MTADREHLRALVAEQKERLDVWLATLEGCLDEAEDMGGAEADPRLEAADDALDDVDVRRQFAAAEVLGLVGPEPGELEAELEFLTDEFFIRLLIGVPEEGQLGRLDDVLPFVEEAADRLADRLVEAGYEIHKFDVARGDLMFTGDEDDEEDE